MALIGHNSKLVNPMAKESNYAVCRTMSNDLRTAFASLGLEVSSFILSPGCQILYSQPHIDAYKT